MAVGLAAAGDGEKFFLELAGDGAGDAFTHLDVIDAANRRDFHRCTGKENFMDDVQQRY